MSKKSEKGYAGNRNFLYLRCRNRWRKALVGSGCSSVATGPRIEIGCQVFKVTDVM